MDNDSELDRTGFRFLSIGTGLNRIALFFIWNGLNRFGELDRTGLTHESSLGRSGVGDIGKGMKT